MQEKLIQLNIDNVSYKTKAAAASEYGKIRNRIGQPGSIRRVTVEGLKICIERGVMFAPAVMTGRGSDSWQQQEVICIDVDNEEFKTKKQLERIMSIEEARSICVRWFAQEPTIIYKTFSYSDEWPRYRLVFVLSEPLTDRDETKALIKALANIFSEQYPGATDPSEADVAKLFLGSRSDSVAYFNEAAIMPIEYLRALPKVEEPEDDPKEGPEEDRSHKKTYYSYDLQRLQDKCDSDIKSFDLISYLKGEGFSLKRTGNTKYINPCPICGGNNDFQVFGASWVCYGAKGAGYGQNGNKPGGTIVDLLRIRNGLSKGKALEMFKYDLMRYDRREWSRAYFEQKKQEEKEEDKRKNRERIRKMLEGGKSNE